MSSKMMFYILKRVLLALATIWIVITVTFFVMHAVPGNPFAGEKALTAEAQAALEAKYGLDKPLLEQYTTYLKDLVTKFDFGPSMKLRGRMVMDVIMDGMKTSAKLGLIAAFAAAVTAPSLISFTAVSRYTGTLLASKKSRRKLVLARHTPLVTIRSSIISTMVGFLPWRYSS